MGKGDQYPGFDHSADQICKYQAVLDFFTIMLKDGRIIHYTPADLESFQKWLLQNKIKDIRNN
jgi:hypothetical protein